MEKEYSIELLKQLEQYNHERYISHLNNTSFDYIKEFEQYLSARYMKVSRINKLIVFLF